MFAERPKEEAQEIQEETKQINQEQTEEKKQESGVRNRKKKTEQVKEKTEEETKVDGKKEKAEWPMSVNFLIKIYSFNYITSKAYGVLSFLSFCLV